MLLSVTCGLALSQFVGPCFAITPNLQCFQSVPPTRKALSATEAWTEAGVNRVTVHAIEIIRLAGREPVTVTGGSEQPGLCIA